MDKKVYSVLNRIDIRFADPICAMDMNSQYMIIGSMMGRIALIKIRDQGQVVNLVDLSNENISNLCFVDNIIYASIGDEEVYEYNTEPMNNKSISSTCIKYQNYRNEIEHNKHCQNSFTMMNGINLLKIILGNVDENEKEILTPIDCEYDYRNLKTKEIGRVARLKMSKSSVPFDFDGKRFLWLDFYSSTYRNICIAYLPNEDIIWKKELNKDFGHISHAKFLNETQLFIVRNVIQCEIRRADNDFTLDASFNNIGEEVICAYICTNDLAQSNTEIIQQKVHIHSNIEEYSLKVNTMDNRMKDHEAVHDEQSKNKYDDNTKIILLDIEGNINIYQNHQISTVFNINQVTNIPKEHHDRHFFGMGYPYYIKAVNEVYAITTDHGCYIIGPDDH